MLEKILKRQTTQVWGLGAYLHLDDTNGKLTIINRSLKKAWQIQLPEIDYDEKAPWA